jgi:sugar lactone lactonase YvrE
MKINQLPAPAFLNGKSPIRRLAAWAVLLAALAAPQVGRAQVNYATPYTFTTFAGTPFAVSGADGTGPTARFNAPYGTAVDSSGNVYVADLGNDTIRKITPSGVVTTLAGMAGVAGSADGQGSAARFNTPVGVAVDTQGNVYVSDEANETIRKITPGGLVSTFAGQVGVGGTTNGTGTGATFSSPAGIGVDPSGNVYVADQTDSTIRKITPGGVVTILAGTTSTVGFTDGAPNVARFNNPYGLAVDPSGNVYVADTGNRIVRMITPSGTVSTIAGTAKVAGTANGTGPAASFETVLGIAADGSGNVYVSDEGIDETIRKIAPGGVVTTFAGRTGIEGYVDGPGNVAEFDGPFGVSVDSSGNLYVADITNNEIRKITSGGVVSTLAGSQPYADGPGSSALFNVTPGVATDSSGNVYVVDEDNDLIRKITPAGVVSTLAGSPGNGGYADGTGSAAQFYFPFALCVDSGGNVYVCDGANTIRKVTPGGVVTTVAGTGGVTGNANGTGAAAQFSSPTGITVDSSGNLYVAEQQNQTIRKITPAGVVTTLAGTAGATGSLDGTGSAARFDLPAGIAIDSNGNLFLADATNDEIRKITLAGVVTTIAGSPQLTGDADGTGSAARFFYPVGLAIDSHNNIFIADDENDTIREMTEGGVVTTIGGTPGHFGSTDGTGASALFYAPEGVAVDGAGNVYVGDALNNTVRKGVLSAAPQIESQPTEQFTSVGGSATFTVTATGAGDTYQWNFNGTAIPGATGSSYTVTNAQASNAGTYTVTITDADGSTTSAGAALSVNTGATTSRLTNISTRAHVGTGGNILIPGLYISGSGTETLLVRADGPALTQYGVTGVLAQPILSIFDSTGALVATNTGWSTGPNAAQIPSISASVGAFALAAGSADSALVANLTAGAYTVQISGVGSTQGVALAEVYEVSATGTARLANISTRAAVGTGGNILIPGIYIAGTGSEELLIRADGPALTQYGVSGVLAQPTLSVFDSTGTLVASNTAWGTGPNASEIPGLSASVGAFALAAGSQDCALVVNLPPGGYTIQISGLASSTGVALAEVYEIP